MSIIRHVYAIMHGESCETHILLFVNGTIRRGILMNM